jgi:hypothetical protein
MPFELGLAVALEKMVDPKHSWYVFEAVNGRVEKSLSDLGTDVYIHGETVHGVLSQLSNAFIRQKRQPTVPQMISVYRYIRRELRTILATSGAHSIFDGARAFRDVSVAAILKAEGRV